MAEGQNVGSIFAEIQIEYVDFGLKKAEADLKKFDINFKQLGTQLFRFGAILTAFGGGTLLMMKKMAETASTALSDTRFSEAMMTFEESSLGLQMMLGEILIPTITDMTNKLTEMVDWIQTSVPKPILDAVVNFIAWSAAISLVVGSASLLFGGIFKVIGGVLWLETILKPGMFASWASGITGAFNAITRVNIVAVFTDIFSKIGLLFNWFKVSAIPALITAIQTGLGGAMTWLAANPIVLLAAALVGLMYVLEETGHSAIIWKAVMFTNTVAMWGFIKALEIAIRGLAFFIELQSGGLIKPNIKFLDEWDSKLKTLEAQAETTKNQLNDLLSGKEQQKGGFVHDMIDQLNNAVDLVKSGIGGAFGAEAQKPKTVADFISSGGLLPSQMLSGQTLTPTVVYNIDFSNAIVTDDSLQALQDIINKNNAASIKEKTVYGR